MKLFKFVPTAIYANLQNYGDLLVVLSVIYILKIILGSPIFFYMLHLENWNATTNVGWIFLFYFSKVLNSVFFFPHAPHRVSITKQFLTQLLSISKWQSNTPILSNMYLFCIRVDFQIPWTLRITEYSTSQVVFGF